MSDRVTIGALGKELTTVRQTLEVHLAECAILRKENINALVEMKDAVKWQSRTALGVLLSIIAWAGIQLWNGQAANHAVDAARLAALERPLSQ
jgi:hypothetical protein